MGSQRRITLKFSIRDKFDTLITKNVVPKSKNQRIDHAHAPPLQNEKMLGSQRKLVPRPNSVQRIQKLWFRILKNKGSTTPMPHPTKMNKWSYLYENWHQDQTRHVEFKNHGPES